MTPPASESLVTPTEGVRVIGPFWEYPDLGLRIYSPPRIIDRNSCGHEIACALQAADLGMACIRRSPRSKRLRFDSSPLRPVHAAPLRDGLVAALVQTMLVSLTALGGPLSLLALAWLASHITDQPVLAFLSASGLYLLISLALHECGHVLAYRLLAGRAACAITVRTTTRLRVVRKVLRPRKDILVTLAGPLTPMITPLLLAPWAQQVPLHLAAALAVAMAHMFQLLLPFGDGAAFRAAVRSTRQK
jgi:hypothetical protein